ncbi:NAD(P)-dependent oxidoreductase [Tolypothrix bouteillei VB521301]|uniref:3-hydroxyisobutyrate dehydrogenase n=3 Tax=Nostocales TaxID=1161 RepID=A0A0C1QP76_9CYAN|nr:NAD(P)-dependent oxidoreductase [Tolypothrix bouteillei VB521301]
MKRIAVLGAGAMGSRIVQNLLNAKYQVVVYNRTASKVKPLLDRGAVYATTPKEAAEQADIVISMVTDNDVSRSIWLDPKIGAALGLSKDAITIESSTLTVDWTRELADEILNRGAAFLDAPVVGSRQQAEAKKLIYLVGGKAQTLAQVQPVLLSAGASSIHHIGSVGQGMTMKLAVNALFGIQVAALAEIIGMLDKNGITSVKAMQYLGDLPVISPAALGAGSLMAINNHAPMFPIELVEKDFRYFIQTAQAFGALIPASTAIHNIYQEAMAFGYGNDNITGVVQIFI